MHCAHSKIEAALDRWSECHWHIHQMEGQYHFPDPFRYSLNSFIRALKEIPQILQMELQNHPLYREKFSVSIRALQTNQLISLLNKKRDFVVHRGMLEVLSKGNVGTVEGAKIKIAFGYPVQPFESTQEAYDRFKRLCKKDSTIRSLMGPDCDSTPMIRREWKIPDFPDTELLEVAVSAWRASGNLLSEILVSLGAAPIDLSMDCRHDPERVRIKRFSQSEFFREVDGIDLETEQAKYAEQYKRSRKPTKPSRSGSA